MVSYTQTTFDLQSPHVTFDFLFQLYNYAAVTKQIHAKLSPVRTELHNLKTVIHSKELKGFTTKTGNTGAKRKRTDEPEDGGNGGADELQGSNYSLSSPFDDSSISTPIINRGYTLYEEVVVDGWEPMNPVRHNPSALPMNILTSLCKITGMLTRGLTQEGVHVVFKFLPRDTDELAILQCLQEADSPNHVIPLLDIVPVYLGSCIVMPYALPLDLYTEIEDPLVLIYQFLHGVSFIHDRNVAHLDLKPDNVVIVARGGQPWLYIIDFGVSVRATLDTIIDGFVGTPPWVAPEVGSKGGHAQFYNPIRADRWAAGRMLRHLTLRHRDFDYTSVLAFAEKLMSREPLQRPSLRDHTLCQPLIIPHQKRTAPYFMSERPQKISKENDLFTPTSVAIFATST